MRASDITSAEVAVRTHYGVPYGVPSIISSYPEQQGISVNSSEPRGYSQKVLSRLVRTYVQRAELGDALFKVNILLERNT